MINWNDIEEVTALVEEHEELITERLSKDNYLYRRLQEVGLTNEYIVLWYRSAWSDYDSEQVIKNITPILVFPDVLERIIEQHTTEIIDDNENGFRRGE